MNYTWLPEGKVHYTRYAALGRDTRTLCNRFMNPDKGWRIPKQHLNLRVWIALRNRDLCKNCERIHGRI